MLPALIFQITGFLINLILALFVIYYILKLRAKEKEVEKKAEKIDTSYHQIVDDALSKERKILDDATSEASHIINDAKYVNSSSQQTVEQALHKLINDIQKDATGAAEEFKKSYKASLEQIASSSLTGFQNVSQEIQTDLEKQIKLFHDTLLPGLQKELDDYKQERLKQTEQTITHIIQKASQEIFNQSISFEDHQQLMLNSLEKAKKEGMFD
ncbi:hypothetical protein HZA75_00915 [Candidatus Roizmanbacteria bacterium]|nr:hypothetical protein [Candidatus Roizmanbacteria bacterium]